MEMIVEGRRIAHEVSRQDAGLRQQAPRAAASRQGASTGVERRHPMVEPSVLSTASAFHSGEFLAFHLGNEEYCLEILKVLEIRSHQPTTRIANAPAHIKGMIDLRGTIVPILDLRMIFGLQPAAIQSTTVTIVLNLLGRTVGLVVDSVSDVVHLAAREIKPAPLPADLLATSGVAGIASIEGRTLSVLDIEALMRRPSVGLSS